MTAIAGTEAAQRFVEQFAAGWRDAVDADAFSDHFEPLLTDDVRLIQPQVPTTVGKKAFREVFARPLFELIPDIRAEVHRWAAREDFVLIEFTLSGTLGGRPVSWKVVDRIILRDGLVAERLAYFDPTPLLAAIATRPRAWPTFARLQFSQIRNRLRGGDR
jgi:ketosteroid isomerase-like protein